MTGEATSQFCNTHSHPCSSREGINLIPGALRQSSPILSRCPVQPWPVPSGLDPWFSSVCPLPWNNTAPGSAPGSSMAPGGIQDWPCGRDGGGSHSPGRSRWCGKLLGAFLQGLPGWTRSSGHPWLPCGGPSHGPAEGRTRQRDNKALSRQELLVKNNPGSLFCALVAHTLRSRRGTCSPELNPDCN